MNKTLTEWRPILLGAAGGAMGVMLLGFLVFGWVPAGMATQAAQEEAKAAVVAALSGVCVTRFNSDAAMSANLQQLKALTSFEQGPYIAKGGWAATSDSEPLIKAVAKSCAVALVAS